MPRWYSKDSQTGNMIPLGVKVEDTLPVGTEIDYDGQDIPEGWERIDKVLYNNSTGSNANITLDGNVDDYTKLEIEYYVVANANRYSQIIPLISGANTSSSLNAIQGTVAGGSEQTIYTSNIGIIRTTNTIEFGRYATIKITNGNVSLTTTNNIYITKVIGYK